MESTTDSRGAFHILFFTFVMWENGHASAAGTLFLNYHLG